MLIHTNQRLFHSGGGLPNIRFFRIGISALPFFNFHDVFRSDDYSIPEFPAEIHGSDGQSSAYPAGKRLIR